MTGYRNSIFAASTALAAVLLSGCAMGGGNDRPSGYAAKPLAAPGGKAVAKAEAAVLANPRDARARAALGAAYLNAGRFASAGQAFDDALELGDESVPTVLGLVLTETAQGNAPAALQLLRDYRDVIPAADLGLAYALAGDTERGVSILGEALRGGEASAKTRQNLAYAFALNGQWSEAKLMASQDIPADQVNARIIEWVRMARPDAVGLRVAALLGVSPVADSGQPQTLALANFPSTEQLASEAQAQAPAVAEAAPIAPAAVQQAAIELPPVAPQAAPAVQPVTLAALDRSTPRVASDAPAFVAVPVAQAATPSLITPVTAPRKVGRFVAEGRTTVQPGKAKGLAAAVAAMPKPVAGGSHWIQLGSYTDPDVAKEGWSKFTRRTPTLKGFATVTTTAVVNGTPVWRVAATGFASYADAAKVCARVKTAGGACLVKRAEAGAPAPKGGSMRLTRR